MLQAIGGDLDLSPGLAKPSSNCSPCKRKRKRRSAPNAPPNRRGGGRSAAWRTATRRWPERSSRRMGSNAWSGTCSNYATSPKLPNGSPPKARRRSPRTFGSGESRTARADRGAGRRRSQSGNTDVLNAAKGRLHSPLPAVLPGGAMVSPHEAQGPVATRPTANWRC